MNIHLQFKAKCIQVLIFPLYLVFYVHIKHGHTVHTSKIFYFLIISLSKCLMLQDILGRCSIWLNVFRCFAVSSNVLKGYDHSYNWWTESMAWSAKHVMCVRNQTSHLKHVSRLKSPTLSGSRSWKLSNVFNLLNLYVEDRRQCHLVDILCNYYSYLKVKEYICAYGWQIWCTSSLLTNKGFMPSIESRLHSCPRHRTWEWTQILTWWSRTDSIHPLSK